MADSTTDSWSLRETFTVPDSESSIRAVWNG